MTMLDSSEKIDYLSPDVLPPLDEVNEDVFIDEAKDIFNFIKSEFAKFVSGESEPSLAERSLRPHAIALLRTREKFVNNAEYAELKNLADIILSAPEAQIIQEGLDKIGDRLSELWVKGERAGGLTEQETEERKQLKADKKLEVAKILPFNHKLRELIDTFAGYVSREQIENVVEKAMNGSVGPARKIVAGMGAEVAVARVARKMFGAENVRLSTQPEDAKGIDIVIHVQGKEIRVDVKTGGNIDDTQGNYKEVAVEQKQLVGFDVRPEEMGEIQQKLQDAAR